MDLLDQLFDIARRRNRKIVLPEGSDARIVAAARKLKDESLAEPILLGRWDEIQQAASAAKISLLGIDIADPQHDSRTKHYSEALAGIRKSMTAGMAMRLVSKPLYFGGMMVRQEFTPAGFALPLGLKDVKLVLAAADGLEVPLPFAEQLRSRFIEAVAQGHQDLDWSGIALVARESAGLR